MSGRTIALLSRLLLVILLAFPIPLVAEPLSKKFDLVVYGATPAGIAASLTAAEAGLIVLLIEPSKYIGGMMSSGLGGTDHCDKKTVGGFARTFFKELGVHYDERISWRFEPHVAEAAFEKLIAESSVQLLRERSLQSVRRDGQQIQGLKVDGEPQEIAGNYFIDASYEGDLLAQAGVPYAIGRESRTTYNEPDAGVHAIIEKHQIPTRVSPYQEGGQLLPFIEPVLAPEGSGDLKTMAYNFRLCVTSRPENRVPIPEPLSYDAQQYEILARMLQANRNMLIKDLFEFLRLPNGKYDLNNKGGFSTDFVGANHDFPEASKAERQTIVAAHKEFTLGLFHFLRTDPRVPEPLRVTARKLGLCKDEFVGNDNWPYQLYVRVARRMKSDFVLHQGAMNKETLYADPVALASCPIESHSVQRSVVEGAVVNEGWASKKVGAYQIPFRAILPPRGSVDNLLVPVAVSASHISYSSLRMEPVFMSLGEAAAVAVSIAIRERLPLSAVPSEKLRTSLLERKQRLIPR